MSPLQPTPERSSLFRSLLRATAVLAVLLGFLAVLMWLLGWLWPAVAILSGWGELDTWIAVTAALSAMACAVPGVFLVLRRQSMMGDALSHTVLPGIVVALLAAQWALSAGWFSQQGYLAIQHGLVFTGALVLGVLAALLTELVHKLGRVESSAALGVVFTSLFALGLVLIRVAANDVHLDPDCVLYGLVETIIPTGGVPQQTITVGVILLVDLALVALFYKELKISAFDSSLATTLGVNARAMHYALMAVTAMTVVAVFEVVGNIVVIAMLIVPPATAYLLTDRLSGMILISLLVAGSSAVLGHVLAITLPPLLFGALGFPEVRDASTAGMMALAAGLVFFATLLIAPRYGVLSKLLNQAALAVKIAGEDVLGLLYRMEERKLPASSRRLVELIEQARDIGPLMIRWAVFRLRRQGHIARQPDGYHLTASGRGIAQALVRSHRLWESYVAKHFELPTGHLHDTAERVEHYIGPGLRRQLEAELDQPEQDPHGSRIPKEGDTPS